jgi:hypothetical protein
MPKHWINYTVGETRGSIPILSATARERGILPLPGGAAGKDIAVAETEEGPGLADFLNLFTRTAKIG